MNNKEIIEEVLKEYSEEERYFGIKIEFGSLKKLIQKALSKKDEGQEGEK